MFKRVLFVAIMLSLFTLSACSGSQSVKRSQWNMGSAESFQESFVFEADPMRNLTDLQLEIDVDIKEGQASLVATNPNGEDVWSGDTDSKLRVREKFDIIPGEWTLVVTVSEARGSVKTVWKGTK
ncbi:MAG: hypothetical protein FH749_02865 [Firmicutes bacterium]|nr:hypothetical protein [Bacillota bacterium]